MSVAVADLAVEVDRNALAASILPAALAYARKKARGRSDLSDELQDAATDAVERAVRRHQPDRGAFRPYAWRGIQRAVGRALRLWLDRRDTRPETLSIDGDAESRSYDPPDTRPTGLSELHPDTVRILPPGQREAVELYCVEGYTLREAGERLGITAAAVRARLIAAAERIAGRPAVAFCKGEHRFKR
jgi:RNA polymerase sigma factor (sigma-70 family)